MQKWWKNMTAYKNALLGGTVSWCHISHKLTCFEAPIDDSEFLGGSGSSDDEPWHVRENCAIDDVRSSNKNTLRVKRFVSHEMIFSSSSTVDKVYYWMDAGWRNMKKRKNGSLEQVRIYHTCAADDPADVSGTSRLESCKDPARVSPTKLPGWKGLNNTAVNNSYVQKYSKMKKDLRYGWTVFVWHLRAASICLLQEAASLRKQNSSSILAACMQEEAPCAAHPLLCFGCC